MAKRTHTRRSWQEKLEDSKDLPKVIPIPAGSEKRWGKGTMLIPSPKMVDEVIRKVRKGRVATINGLRTALAEGQGTSQTCPITTGIFSWIAAHASEERSPGGRGRSATPWWRVLKEGGRLNPKYPGGVQEQSRRLKAEGLNVASSERGGHLQVQDFEDKLANL